MAGTPLEDLGIADTIRQSMSEVAATGAVVEGAIGDAVPVHEGSVASQPRDEKGRYSAKAEEPDEEEQPEVEEKPVEVKEPDEPKPVEAVEPPTNWSLEEQNRFRKLDAETQKFVLEKVESVSKSVPQGYDEVERVIGPRRQAWQGLGFSPAQAISHLLSLSDYAERTPGQFIQWFMQQRGLTPEQVGFTKAAVPDQVNQPVTDDPIENDPVVKGLRSELSGLKQTLDRLQGTVMERAQNEERSLQTNVDNEINQFRGEKGTDGALLHPYFDEVRPLMGALVQSGQAGDLKQAYEMACYANSSVRGKIEAAAAAKAERENRRKEAEKAKSARRLGSTVAGQPSSPTNVPAMSGDLRDDLRAELVRAGMIDSQVI